MRRLLGLAAVMTVVFCGLTPAAMATPQRQADRAGSAVLATTAPGSFGIRLVDVPVSAAADSRAWRYIVDFVHPGTEIRRRIAVQNNTPETAVVRVYAGPATITHGEFVGGAPQSTSDLTTWTSVSHPVLRLAPWATAMDLVTIRVSRYASPGERYGVVWAQESSRANAASHLGIIEVNRVGVRIYLDVGPGGLPPTRFAITAITGGRTPGGSPEVVASVRNTGKRAIDVGGTVSLSDGPGNFSSGLRVPAWAYPRPRPVRPADRGPRQDRAGWPVAGERDAAKRRDHGQGTSDHPVRGGAERRPCPVRAHALRRRAARRPRPGGCLACRPEALDGAQVTVPRRRVAGARHRARC